MNQSRLYTVEQTSTVIQKQLFDQDSIFVFPSEVAASSWRLWLIKNSPNKAVISSRFISWDGFKECAFLRDQKRTPVNSIIRLFFSSNLLTQNKETPFLAEFIPKEQAENSELFASYLSQQLPLLKSFFSNENRLTKVKQTLLTDLQKIYARYQNFLTINALFEPGYEEKIYIHSQYKYFIFYSPLIEDYHEYAGIISKEKAVQLIIDQNQNKQAQPLRVYPTLHDEIHACFHNIELLLAKGFDLSDFAITVAKLDSLAPFLRKEAVSYGFELNIRQGLSLLDHSPGQLILLLKELDATNFAFLTMQKLFYHSCLPWKHRKLWIQILHIGMQKRIFRNHTKDLWYSHLKENQELQNLYSGLKNAIFKILFAKDFAELRESFQTFLYSYIDSNKWDKDQEKVLQRILISLDELEFVEESLEEVEKPSIFSIFLSHLSSQVYVFSNFQSGINVFPYKVSAGMAVKHHFILQLNHKDSIVQQALFPFIREDMHNETATWMTEQTEDFFKTYSLSGEKIQFSMSRKSMTEGLLPPGYFLSESTLHEIEKSPLGDIRARAAYEVSFWKNLHKPLKLSPSSYEGLQHFSLTSQKRSENFCKQSIIRTATHLKLLKQQQKDSLTRLSAYPLKQYLDCPFLYLVSHFLNLEEKNYIIEETDFKMEGNIIHTAMQLLFEYIQQNESRFRSTEISDYEIELEKILNVLENESRLSFFIEEDKTLFFSKLLSALKQLLITEAELFPNCIVSYLEKAFEYKNTDEGYSVNLRIDRVSKDQQSGQHIIIDYKRSDRAGLSKLLTEDKRFSDIQVPLYVYILEELGYPVETAAYYHVFSKKTKNYSLIFQRNNENQNDLTVIKDKIPALLSSVHQNLLEGNFHVISQCEPCTLRPICRVKYALQ